MILYVNFHALYIYQNVSIESKFIDVLQGIPMLDLKNNEIGQLRSAAYSPKFNKVVGIAMIEKGF